MKVSLLRGLDKQGAQDVKASFLQAAPYRNALIKNLRYKISEGRKKSRSQTFLLEGDYAVKMAWAMAYEQSCEELILLLSGDGVK